MPKKYKSRKISKRLTTTLVILSLIIGGFAYSLKYEDKIDEKLGLRSIEYYNPGDMVRIGRLSIHFIDVGQGDACLIELPDDKTVLIDAGENRKSVKDKLTSYIDEVNQSRQAQARPLIRYFDFVIATHSDSDHIGSLAYILGIYPAAVFYRPNEESVYQDFIDPANNGQNQRNQFWGQQHGEKNTKTYKEAIEAGYRQHENFIEAIVTNPHDSSQNCIKPDLNPLHDLYYELNFYGPISSYYLDHNDYSPIIIVEYKGRRIALSGDCEKKGEEEFIAAVNNSTGSDRFSRLKNSEFNVDIIKLGHHGSRTSSSQDYLNIMVKDPVNVYVVISCGIDNQYKHPHSEVLERIRSMGIKQENVLRTDQDGDIYFSLSYYQEKDKALVEKNDSGITYLVKYKTIGEIKIGDKKLSEISFINENFGLVQMRYRLIGSILLFVVLIIILPFGFNKKSSKKSSKNKK